MIKIKETKSVLMDYSIDTHDVSLAIGGRAVIIPMKSIFQVRRGLESAVQRFYRKHEKINRK